MGIWAWIKASKIGIWLAAAGSFILGIIYFVWSYKRSVTNEVLYEIRDKQHEAADKATEQAKDYNKKTREIVKLVPRDWESVERMRKSGKKIKIPTD